MQQETGLVEAIIVEIEDRKKIGGTYLTLIIFAVFPLFTLRNPVRWGGNYSPKSRQP